MSDRFLLQGLGLQLDFRVKFTNIFRVRVRVGGWICILSHRELKAIDIGKKYHRIALLN